MKELKQSTRKILVFMLAMSLIMTNFMAPGLADEIAADRLETYPDEVHVLSIDSNSANESGESSRTIELIPTSELSGSVERSETGESGERDESQTAVQSPGEGEPEKSESAESLPEEGEPAGGERGGGEPGGSEPGKEAPGEGEPGEEEPGGGEARREEAPGEGEPSEVDSAGVGESGEKTNDIGEPGEEAPGEGEPADEGGPREEAPGESGSGEGEPGEGEPGEEESGEGEPGEEEPGDSEPGEEEPGDSEPGEEEPGEEEPGDGEPGYSDPGEEEPGEGEPGYSEPGEIPHEEEALPEEETPEEEEIEANISFSFTNPLILDYEEIMSGGDVNELLLIGVSAVDENENDVSNQVYVLDDGGFAEFFNSVSASGDNGVSPSEDDGIYAFEGEVTYAVEHQKNGEVFVSDPREVLVRNEIGVLDYPELIPLDVDIPGELVLDKVAAPGAASSQIDNNWEWDITLTLRGLDILTTSDIVLVIDTSGSMGAGASSKVTYAKNAALLFVRQLLKGDDRTRIAVVDYNTTATVRNGLTTNLGTLEGAINALSAMGGTNIQDGIAKAQGLLSTSTANNKYIVLLSDGDPTYSYPCTAATNVSITSCIVNNPVWSVTTSNVNTTNFSMLFNESGMVGDGANYTIAYTGSDANKGALIRCPSNHNHPFPPNHGISTIYQAKMAKSEDIDIYTVAVASGATGEMVLQQCASGVNGAGHSYAIANSTPGELDKLEGIFSEISGKILYAASSAVVTDPVGEVFNLVSNISTSKGTATFNPSPAPGTITWNVGDVRQIDDVITMKYTVRIDTGIANPETMYPTNKTTYVNYIDVYGDNTVKPFPIPQVGYPQVGSITQMIYVVDELGRPLDAQGQPAASRDLIDIIEMVRVINPTPVSTDPYVFHYGTYTVNADLYRTIDGLNYRFVQGAVLNMGDTSPTSVTVNVSNQSARVYYAYQLLGSGWVAPNWERLREAINYYDAPTITIFPGGYVNDDGIPEVMIGGVPVLEDLAAGRLVVIDNDDPENGGTNQAVWRTDNGIESGIWVSRAVTIVAYGGTTVPLISRTTETTRHFYVQPGASLIVDRGIVIDGNKDANVSSSDTVGGVRVSGGVFALRPDAAIINSRAYLGGGVSVTNSGVFNMSGGDISGNEAWPPGAIIPDTGLGGGVYIAGGQFAMTGGAISGNTAGSSGGGVHMESGVFQMNGACSITGNDSRMGGGVRVLEGTFTLTSGSIDNNVSSVGGGVNVGKSESDIGTGYAYFYINGGTINNNLADSNGGGASIYRDGTAVMNSGEIVYNESKGSGGGVVVARGGEFSLVSGRINNNYARGSGGGLILDDGVFTMTGGEISDNEAVLYGGGISVNGSSFMMGGGGIVGNKATIGGGGVDVVGETSQFVMGSGEINQNEANSGGGIVVDGGECTINGGLIRDNRAASNGGGIFVGNAAFTLGNGTISDNVAVSGSGGGVFLYSIRENGFVDIESGSIINNRAENGNGGGINVYSVGAGRSFEMKGGSINGNEALYGGGMYVRDVAATGGFELSGGAIVNNEAAYDGGGIFTRNHRWMIIGAGVSFSGNTAGYGEYRLEEYRADGVYDPGFPITVGELIALHGPAAQIRTSPPYSAPGDGGGDFLYLANNFDLNFNGDGTLKPGTFDKTATSHMFNGVGDTVEYTVSYKLPSSIGGYEGFLIFDDLPSTLDYFAGSGSVAVDGATIGAVSYNSVTRTVSAYIPKGDLIANALIEVKFIVTVNSNWLAEGGPITNTAYYIIDRADDGAEPDPDSGNADDYAEETVYPTVEKPGDYSKDAAAGSKMYTPGVTDQVSFDISFTIPDDDNLQYYTVRIVDEYSTELTYADYNLSIGAGGTVVPINVAPNDAAKTVVFTMSGPDLLGYAGEELSLTLTFDVSPSATDILINNAEMFFDLGDEEDPDPIDDDAEIPPIITKPADFMKIAAEGSKTYKPHETEFVTFDVSFTVPDDPALEYYMVRLADTFDPELAYVYYTLRINGALNTTLLTEAVDLTNHEATFTADGADLMLYAGQSFVLSLVFRVSDDAEEVLVNNAQLNFDRDGDEDQDPVDKDAEIPPAVEKPSDFMKDAASGSKTYKPGVTDSVTFEIKFTVPTDENLKYYQVRIFDVYSADLIYTPGSYELLIGGAPVPALSVTESSAPAGRVAEFTLDGADLINYAGEEFTLSLTFGVLATATDVLVNSAELNFEREGDPDEDPVSDDAEIPPVVVKPDDFMKEAAQGSKTYKPGTGEQVTFNVSYTVPNDPNLTYYTVRLVDTYGDKLSFTGYSLTIGGVLNTTLAVAHASDPSNNSVTFIIEGADLYNGYAGEELVLTLTFDVDITATEVLTNSSELFFERDGDPDDDPVDDDEEIPPVIEKPGDFVKESAAGSKTYKPGVTPQYVTFDISFTVPVDDNLSYYMVRILDTYDPELTYAGYELLIDGVSVPAISRTVDNRAAAREVEFVLDGAELASYAGQEFSLSLTFGVSATAEDVLTNNAKMFFECDGDPDDDPADDDAEIPPVRNKPADFSKEPVVGSMTYKPGVTDQVTFEISFTIPDDQLLFDYYMVRIVDKYDPNLDFDDYALTIGGSPVPLVPGFVEDAVNRELSFTLSGADLEAYVDQEFVLTLTFDVNPAAKDVLTNWAYLYFDRDGDLDDDPSVDIAEIPPIIEKPGDFAKDPSTGSQWYTPGVTQEVTFDISFTIPNDPVLSYYMIRIVDTYETGLHYTGFVLTIDGAASPVPMIWESPDWINQTVAFKFNGAELTEYAGKKLNLALTFDVLPSATGVLRNTAQFNYDREDVQDDDPEEEVAEIPPVVEKPGDFMKDSVSGNKTYKPGVTTQVDFDISFTVPEDENLVYFTVRIEDIYSAGLAYADSYTLTIDGAPVTTLPITVNHNAAARTVNFVIDGADLIAYGGLEFVLTPRFSVALTATGVLRNEAKMFFERGGDEDDDPAEDEAIIPPEGIKPGDFAKEAAYGSKMYKPGVTDYVTFEVSFTIPEDENLEYYTVRIVDSFDKDALSYSGYVLLVDGGSVPGLAINVNPNPAGGEVTFTLDGADLIDYAGLEFMLKLTFSVSPAATGVLENRADMYFERGGDTDDDPVGDTAEIPPEIAKPDDFEKISAEGSKTYTPGVTTQVSFNVNYTVPSNPLLSYYTIRITDTYQTGLTYSAFQLKIGGVVMPAAFPIIATPSGNTVVFEVRGADLLSYAGQTFSLALTFNVSPTATGDLMNSAEFNYVREDQPGDDPIEDEEIIPPVDFVKEAAYGFKFYTPGVTEQVRFNVSFTIPDDVDLEPYTVRIVDAYDAHLRYFRYALTIGGVAVPITPIVNSAVTGVVTFTFNGADLAGYAGKAFLLTILFDVYPDATDVLVNRADMYFDLGADIDENPVSDTAEIPPVIDYPDDYMMESAIDSKFYRPGMYDNTRVTFNISFTVPDDPLLSYYNIRILDTFGSELSYVDYALTIDGASVVNPRDIFSEPLDNRVTFIVNGADLVAYAGKTLNLAVVFNVNPNASGILRNVAEFNYVREGQPGGYPITDTDEIPPQ